MRIYRRRPREGRWGSDCSVILHSREHIARAPDGEDAARLLRIVLDQGAKPRDMDIDRAVVRLVRGAFHRIHQLVTRQDAPGPVRERSEQVELIGGDANGPAIDPDRPGTLVYLEPAEAEDVGRGAVGETRPAQHGAQAGEQLTRLERPWGGGGGARLQPQPPGR